MDQSKIVCILGPHRSGTSALTRVLNLLGLYLGPEDLMRKPRAWNPLGYWELQAIIDLNDQILARFGGSWHDPPAFTLQWESSPEVEDLRQLARNLIVENFAGAKLWGWKEPRTCLTLPFWQQVVQPSAYVICLRSPVEAALSLKRRNRFSLEKGIELWSVYLKLALEHSESSERCFVFYEDLLSDWQREVQSLSEFLGSPLKRGGMRRAIAEFLNPRLRHHDLSAGNALHDSPFHTLSESLKLPHELYTNLREAAKTERGRVPQMLHEALTSIMLP